MNIQLLIDLHKGNPRQGPGDDSQTRLALQLAGVSCGDGELEIADIGCGTGSSSLVLAKELGGRIRAVDLFPEFLSVLGIQAEKEGLADRIETVVGSMESLPFDAESLDVIWSEGAIYNMGFENGIRAWKPFLRKGGLLAVSEITWLSNERPSEIEAHWNSEYPEISTAGEKICILEREGFSLVGYFVLPEFCWTKNYFETLERSFPAFLERNPSEEAHEIVKAQRQEADLYRRYPETFSYGFYIARKGTEG